MPVTKHNYYIEQPDGYKLSVPGCSTIVKHCERGSEGLLVWAWNLGKEGKTLQEARDTACNIGTVVHEMVQASLDRVNPERVIDKYRGQVDEDKTRQAFKNWERWREQNKLEVIAQESPLVSTRHKFGGTLDLVATLNGKLSIVDWKTSNSLYPTYIVQVAGYGLLYEENTPGQMIEEYHILRMSKFSTALHHSSWTAESEEMKDARLAICHAAKLYRLMKSVEGAC